MPLAPRLHFPGLREKGAVFFFTDAAREAGTGFGAFSVIEYAEARNSAPWFPYLSQRWTEELLRALRADALSMAAGELFGNVAMAMALAALLPGVTHVACFTDSLASVGALNSGNSPSLQLNALVQWLFAQLPGVQFLAIHQQGIRNERADGISRHRAAAVVAEAAAAGLRPLQLGVAARTWEALQRALAAPQRAHT